MGPQPSTQAEPAAGAAWTARLGALPRPEGTRFRVWAPAARKVEVLVQQGDMELEPLPLAATGQGYFEGLYPSLGPGTLYRYRLDGAGAWPDPCSRFQPQGVHGPSEVVAPSSFRWTDQAWTGRPWEGSAVYELHLGTFSPQGGFRGAMELLPKLAELGVTTLELMPVADFPGGRGWGYDGAALYAPSRAYGRPDELRALVDAAHRLGLAVLLDVVYNHFGPDGNYTGLFSPYYMDQARQGPWGASINLGGPQSGPVRAFYIENALHWLHEYHFDGLRLDAVHALKDEGTRPFLAELASTVRASARPGLPPVLVAEDNRNLAALVRPAAEGGLGLDAVWADDFHHQCRRILAGDHEAWFADFSPGIEGLVRILKEGWLYSGQYAASVKAPRGSSPLGLPPERFVFCLQNHDQVGNRALGERLHHQLDPAAYRAASVLLLAAAQTPLLFMGQEWAASSPFQYFTDHAPELGKAVTEGRRKEFAAFSAFQDETSRARIPDPQAAETFERSRLRWEERSGRDHAQVLKLYRDLLRLRSELLTEGFDAAALGPDAVALLRLRQDEAYCFLIRLRGAGAVRLAPRSLKGLPERPKWSVVWGSEDPAYCGDPRPIQGVLDPAGPSAEFLRPGAVVLRSPR